jgi:hypothetical protein
MPSLIKVTVIRYLDAGPELGCLKVRHRRFIHLLACADQDQVVETHDLLKPACQVMEQRLQVSVRANCIRNGQKDAVLLGGRKRMSVS